MTTPIERHRRKAAAAAERARLADRARLEEALAPYIRPPRPADGPAEIDLRDRPRVNRPLRADRPPQPVG